MRRNRRELQSRWMTAVESYRRSVDLYRQVLELRSQQSARARPFDGFVSTRTVVVEPDESASSVVALTGGDVLTPREREVAALIARGLTNQQIAVRLVVTRGTVANHVAHILSKLGLANRTQVAAYVARDTRPSAITNGHLSA